jgi:cytochrome c-type biogenesis protein CcmH
MALKKLGLSAFLSLVLALLAIGVSFAQDTPPTPLPVTDDQVNAVAKNLYCPVCENTPLDVCPTQACAEWRELIRDQLSQGWNEQQIKAYFVERFGDRVLATPPARGLNWLVYMIPPLAFIAGAYLLFRAFKSWRSPDSTDKIIPAEEIESAKDPYVEKLEEELRKL